MKKCTKCKLKKLSSEFGKDSSRADGLSYKCKPCVRLTGKTYWKKNKEAQSARNRAAYQINRERVCAQHKIYYEANKSQFMARYKKRQASKLQATPPWLNVAHHVEMEEMYRYHQIFKGVMPERLGWDVDHIEPLQGESVRGLHVPWNLQVLPARENRAKQNRISTTGADR